MLGAPTQSPLASRAVLHPNIGALGIRMASIEDVAQVTGVDHCLHRYSISRARQVPEMADQPS